jgi:hypothetical protein
VSFSLPNEKRRRERETKSSNLLIRPFESLTARLILKEIFCFFNSISPGISVSSYKARLLLFGGKNKPEEYIKRR